jgi:hypothetical protein
MRIRAVIFLTIILSGRTYGQTSDTFPKIKDIVKEFYSNYNTDDFEYPYVAIEKRKEGWYIARQRRNNLQMEIIDKFLFYDNNSRKYSSLALRKNGAPKLIDPSIYLDDYTLRKL